MQTFDRLSRSGSIKDWHWLAPDHRIAYHGKHATTCGFPARQLTLDNDDARSAVRIYRVSSMAPTAWLPTSNVTRKRASAHALRRIPFLNPDAMIRKRQLSACAMQLHCLIRWTRFRLILCGWPGHSNVTVIHRVTFGLQNEQDRNAPLC